MHEEEAFIFEGVRYICNNSNNNSYDKLINDVYHPIGWQEYVKTRNRKRELDMAEAMADKIIKSRQSII